MNFFQSAPDLLCFVLKYKMVAVAMLNFIFVWFYGITTCRTSNLARTWHFVQVRAIATKSWEINEIQDGGGRHLEFIIYVDFGHTIYFWYQSTTLLQNCINLCQLAVELLLFVQKFKMADAAFLNFVLFSILPCMYVGPPGPHVPNFVQTYAMVKELWAIDEIQNGGRRHLKFIIFVHFGQMVYFRWQPSTFLQNFIYLRQSAAELLLFVQKSKMAAAAKLDFIFVQYFGIRVRRTFTVMHMPNFLQICAIVNLSVLSILVKYSISGESHLPYCKILFIYVNRRLSYCSLCKNPKWRLPPYWITIL